MKRKRTPEEAIEMVEETSEIPPPGIVLARVNAKPYKCTVCGEPGTLGATDDLCWVCRRLKLSAWRDTDVQMPAQE